MPEQGHIEVDDQADADTCHTQIGHRLRNVNWMDIFDGLDLQNQPLFDENVDPLMAQ
jgi:hypothetical protein